MDSWGIGFVVDYNYVIINKYVVIGFVGMSVGLFVYLLSNYVEVELVNFLGIVYLYFMFDVVVIKFEMFEGKYILWFGGMVFCDFDWVDEVYVFGYLWVLMIVEMVIMV